MNISTGGPHILLFERDQQLAMLLTSELQLAGYECHIARTAVEVFDSIARFPVRLVLVNLAQAAASRREFWVALDTQRRGSGIQVFTFHCSNLAGYGPRDPDDYGQVSMADMEIDGMVGMMKLVDTVRARVPGVEGNTTTTPRIPRTPIQNNLSEPQPSISSRFADSHDNGQLGPASRSANRPLPQPAMNTTNTSVVPTLQGTSQVHLATSPATQLPGGNQATYSDKIRAVLYPNPHSPIPPSGVGAKGNNSASPRYSPYVEPDTSRSYPQQVPPSPVNLGPSSGTSVLQRLANGQIYSSPGLAELSRLVSEYKSSDTQENSSQPIVYQPWGVEGMLSSSNMQVEQIGSNMLTYAPAELPNDDLGVISPMSPLSQPETSRRGRGRDPQVDSSTQAEITASSQTVLRAAPIKDLPLERPGGNQPAYGMAVKLSDEVSYAKETLLSRPISELPFSTQTALPAIAATTENWSVESSSPTSFNESPLAPTQSTERKSPVSRGRETDLLPTEPAYRQENVEVPKRVERVQESAYQRENTEPTRQPDRSPKREGGELPRRAERVQESAYQREGSELSRRAERMQESAYQREGSELARQPGLSQKREGSELPRRVERAQESAYQREVTELTRQPDRVQEPLNLRKEVEPLQHFDRSWESVYQDVPLGKDIDESTDARNAVILDILQSLPAVTTPSGAQEQAIQPQVHNGRATRSLGNVLLDGHLVPQDRLEVAQNIQRMLRGVDMNYQLGEILLMFKLLTPDQLLAASLVGYGLITRTQISALGRIRQELHAIGLEYDLENLVILFRILTPEQVREARSSVLG